MHSARYLPGRARRASARGPRWYPGHRVNPVDGLDLAGEVVKVHAPHRGSCERDSQLWDGVPGKPRCKQRTDGGAVGVKATAGAEVRVKYAFQESKGSGEPGCLGEVGELLPGECLYPDPFAVCGSKISAEAAVRIAAGLIFVPPG